MFVSIFIWNGDGILFAIAMLQDYRDRLLIKRTIKITRNCESPCSYELSVDNGQGDVLTGILPSWTCWNYTLTDSKKLSLYIAYSSVRTLKHYLESTTCGVVTYLEDIPISNILWWLSISVHPPQFGEDTEQIPAQGHALSPLWKSPLICRPSERLRLRFSDVVITPLTSALSPSFGDDDSYSFQAHKFSVARDRRPRGTRRRRRRGGAFWNN